jgi:hypothetical protein
LEFQALPVAAVRVVVHSTELTVDSFETIFVALSSLQGMGFPLNRPVAHKPDG